jgi:hypothetical protein
MDKDDLERATRDHWGRYQRDIDDGLKHYICEKNSRLDGKSLLEAELSWAGERKYIKAEHCETLVLLVGFSLDPLLQSICVYKPDRVLLILNEEGYQDGRNNKEWHEFAQHLIKATNYLKNGHFDGSTVLFLGENIPSKPGYPTKGNPASVFKTLVKFLHDEKDVVIDITGGKKSMVTGAFMYAAYSDARISYVDFEEYIDGRPYGFGCKIGQLSNPYREFALHEWEQVRTLYERYQFRDAQLLLRGEGKKGKSESIMSAMKEYLPDSQTSIQLLVNILNCYEDWDAGLYNEAAEKIRDLNKYIKFEPPAAVNQLGGKWIVTNQARLHSNLFNFYDDTQEFRAYVYDELARINRLIEFNCDYRSAFLRAGSLNEALMLARLIKLIDNEPIKNDMIKALQDKTPGALSVFDNLRLAVGRSFQIGPRDHDYDVTFDNAPEITITIKKQMDWHRNQLLFDRQGGWRQFIHIRNDLAHKYYSPPPSWAKDALNFVTANVEDLWGQKICTQDLQTSSLPWPELVKLCGLSNYLPPNLR